MHTEVTNAARALAASELDSLDIGEGTRNADAAGHANQVE